MKLIDVLQKMKDADLKKEISKQNIKGYSKLKKAEIIKIMTDRPDKFKYLLLQNMNQKKELLQDKVKLKEAKEKIQKLTAKKIPAKKAQQAEVIKPKPKREPMIPKIIKTKTGIVTVKPKKEEPKPAPKKEEPKKEKLEYTKDELKLINLEKEQKKLENKSESLGNSRKNIDEKQNLKSQIMEIKLSIFELKDKLKGVSEKKAIEDEKKAIREFKKNVQDFIKNPNQDILEDIEEDFEYIDDLPEKLQEKLEKAIEKFENKDKKKVEPKKELSTIEEKEIFEKENLNLGTFQKYDNKIYEKANFSFKKPVNNDKLINIIEKNPMVIIRAEIINHFEKIIYQCRENVLNLKNALKLKNKNIKWKDLFKSGSLKDFFNEVKNQKLICLTEKQLNKILKLNILSINDINKYKATLKEEKDLMEKFENKDKKKK